MARRTGKVAFFHEGKGYGYIEWGGGEDLYFSRASLVDDYVLQEGETVTFSVQANAAGETQAIEVNPFPLRNRRSGLKDRRKDPVPSRT